MCKYGRKTAEDPCPSGLWITALLRSDHCPDPSVDRVTIDGAVVKAPEAPLYIALYKPRGVLSTVIAPDARPTVRELVPLSGNIFPVGRLDVDSEGLVLMTNDGELANHLTHPRYGHEKEYRVLVAKHPDEKQIEAWQHGVILEENFKTAPARVRVESLAGKGSWLRIILREGHKRQIRETGAKIGLPVVRIVRVRIGSLQLGSLKPRQWRHLTSKEIQALKEGSKASVS